MDCGATSDKLDEAARHSVTIFAAIKDGACGYLLKGSTPRELIEALHHLHEGGAPMKRRSRLANAVGFRSSLLGQLEKLAQQLAQTTKKGNSP